MASPAYGTVTPRHFLSVATLFATFFVCSTSVAGSDATTFVKRKQAQLATAMAAKDHSSVDLIFDRMLDYDAIAKDSLGKHWGELDATRQAEFRCVLRGLVSQTYRRDLEKTLDYTVTFGRAHRQAHGTLVETTARHRTDRREPPVEIGYLVHDAGNALKVRDIVTEGTSLVENYRQQFSRIIREQGYAELLRRMKQKLGTEAKAC